ncbi:cardiolipin synthase [Synechococcus sp. Cruz-9H2]|nr:cardiolipin synthase [Synechococcus sp. Cruz-9H2]MCP9845183.1 cardiolipin synthase [Synechococcus sp. Edmonson 11F2]MCP9857333.1 cardiolipin synthase [Synechococcus sp. Cruz-9C9]MCP9864579.1 cardiolipin synthase [Synechococcus sp. Cruz-7E5]MCP9871848.1 cardiolipin synthase [Synechococcus sp. Cruz-7B9]
MDENPAFQQRSLVMPEDGIEAVVDLIDQAREELRLKLFKLESEDLQEALLRAHARGVAVRVMLNPRTSGGVRWNDQAFARLQSSGLEVSWTSDSFPVTHETSMVVDNHLALIATFDFSDQSFNETRDYAVLSASAPVVEQVRAGFEADWHHSFFEPDLGVGLVWSSFHSRRQMARLVDSAERTLWIQHPKFADTVILDRIITARERGVKVRVLCGGKHGISDSDISHNLASLRLMERFGVKVRRQKHLQLHAKLILVDGVSALVGSMSIDRSAFDLRRELGIETDFPQVVARLKDAFQHDWNLARKYRAPDPLDPSQHEKGERPPDPNFLHE